MLSSLLSLLFVLVLWRYFPSTIIVSPILVMYYIIIPNNYKILNINANFVTRRSIVLLKTLNLQNL
jgi:hypothetical protein